MNPNIEYLRNYVSGFVQYKVGFRTVGVFSKLFPESKISHNNWQGIQCKEIKLKEEYYIYMIYDNI